MEKILVPTDFSPVADNALEYAIALATAFKSTIYLYHVYSLDSFTYDGNFPRHGQPYAEKMAQQMEKTKLKFTERSTPKGVSIKSIIVEDDIYSLFKTRAALHDINIIVMGSRGASGMTKLLFGSTAATAMTTATVPVLIVPPQCTFNRLHNVVLAIDRFPIAPNVVVPLITLAAKFGAKVTLLNITKASEKKRDTPNDLLGAGVKTVFREMPVSKDINATIDQFIQEEGCDLLCMIRRERGVFKKLFHKSITKTQVFSTRVPLLLLPA